MAVQSVSRYKFRNSHNNAKYPGNPQGIIAQRDIFAESQLVIIVEDDTIIFIVNIY